MKFLHKIILCSIALSSFFAILNAQSIPANDSLVIHKLYEENLKRILNTLRKPVQTPYKEELQKSAYFLKQLDSVVPIYHRGSYWSDLKSETLNIQYSILLKNHDTTQAASLKEYILNLDYFTKIQKAQVPITYAVWKYLQLDYVTALESSYEALNYFEDEKISQQEIHLLELIHTIFLKTKHLSFSEDILDHLRVKIMDSKDPDHTSLYYTSLVELKICQGNYQEAIGLFEKHLKRGKPTILLAEAYVGMGDHSSAKKEYEKFLSSSDKKWFRALSNRHLVILAKIQLYEQKYTKSLQTLNSVENKVNNVFIPDDMSLLLEVYELKAKIHQALKRPTESLENYKLYLQVKDSMNLVREKILFKQINYELKKDQELQQLTAENLEQELANQKLTYWFWIILGSIVFLMILIILSIYFVKGRENLKTKLDLDFVKKAADMKNRMIENMSHEIRTPITVINGYSHLIHINSLHAEKVISYSRKAMESCSQLLNSVDGFLTLSRLEENTLHRKCTPGKIEEFMRNLLSSFEPNLLLKEQDLRYKTNIKSDVLVDFDHISLKEIIGNLISNAIKYSSAKTTIYVTNMIQGKELVCTVKDEGIGISKENIPNIFSRFYQSENITTNEGFGIGLSLVKELVKSIEGTIEVESEKGVGSIFTIRIPINLKNPSLYVQSEEVHFVSLVASQENDTDQKTRNLPKVLIVDDNVHMIQYLKDLLVEKFTLTYASDGERALKLVKETKFDIIISDLRMPKMNGLEFKTKVNSIEGTNNIPFILMTATPLNSSEMDLLTLGIDDYLVKPFDHEEFLARMSVLIENSIYKENIKRTYHNKIEFAGTHSELINRVKKIVNENLLTSGFNAKQLAQEVGYTQQHLSIILRSALGLSPGKLILEIRLLKAYELILNKKFMNLNEVIYAIGLNSRSYFNKVFNQRFGIKPLELMKKNLALDKCENAIQKNYTR